MLGSANLKALVDQSLSVQATAKTTLEFNANQYFDYDFIGIYTGTPATTYTINSSTGMPTGTTNVSRYVTRQSTTDDELSDNPVIMLVDEEDIRYPELFPLEHIFKTDRPGPGIVKLACDARPVGSQTYVGPHVPTSSNANRYYPAAFKSPFKYWRSGHISAVGGNISDANPFIHYVNSFYINSIKVSVQTYSAIPSVYSLQVLLPDSGTPTTWTTVYSNTAKAFPASGVLQVYYNNTATWTDVPQYVDTLTSAASTQAVKINGLRLVVSSMSQTAAALEVIELSPRLVIDITDRLKSYEVDLSVSEDDSPLPVGSVSAQTGSIELIDYDSLMNVKTSTSVLYGYGTKGAIAQLSGRFYGSSLGGGLEDIRVAYMQVDQWSPDAQRNIKVDLIDSFKQFQTMPAPRAVYSGKTLTQIIRRIADWIGFSNIAFYKHDLNAAEDPVIPMFICDDDSTAYEVIRDLAEAHQCSIFIDGYNVMRVYSKERLMNDELYTSADFGLRYSASGNLKPNVKTIPETSDGRPVNDISIGYKHKYLLYGAASQFEADQALWNRQQTAAMAESKTGVWQDDSDTTLAASAIVSHLLGSQISQYSVTSNVISITTSGEHGLSANMNILIEGTRTYTAGGVEYSIDGNYTVASAPTITTLTVAVSGKANTGSTINPGGGSVGSAALAIDQESGVAFPEEGYFMIDSEVVFYSGKQWSYKPDGGTSYVYEWSYSDEDTKAMKNRMASGSRFYFTGFLRMAKRGLMGTVAAPHYVVGKPLPTWAPGATAVPGWTELEVMNWSTRDYFASGQVLPVRYTNNVSTSPVRSVNHSMVRLIGISPDEVAARWGWSNVVNDVRLQSFMMYTTSHQDNKVFNHHATGLRILGRQVKDAQDKYGPRGLEGIAGICIDVSNSAAIVNGYFLEVEIQYSTPANNVRIIKYANGVPTTLATGTALINADPNWYNPSVGNANFAQMHTLELYRDYGTPRTKLTAYVDGAQIVSVETEPLPLTARCGVFVRGNTYADVDFYSADTERGSQSVPVMINGSLVTSPPRRISLSSNSISQPALSLMQQQFESKVLAPNIYQEFGSIAHELKIKKADFANSPTINPSMINVGGGDLEAQYYVLKYTSTPFSAEYIVINAGRHMLVQNVTPLMINGFPIQSDNRVYTINDYIDEAASSTGNVTLQTGSDELQKRIKKSLSKYGQIPLTLDSEYIQSKSAAKNLLEWIAQYASFECEKFELEVFGNPLIEPGDVCTLDLSPLDETGYNGTQRFLVTRARHSFDNGYQTNLILRRIAD
jgi:hypothetical protein